MKIQINHLAKMEGHASFIGYLYTGNITKAKIITEEGARLIEGILVGRHYLEAPIITARICGICPVVHALTSIEALEDAFKIKVDPQTLLLRKVMEACQIIHSHTLHLYFLSIPDFYNENDDLKFIKKYPKEAQAALAIRKYATELIEVIGGRTIHPISSTIGGFKKLPDKTKITKVLENYENVYQKALLLNDFCLNLKYPELDRATDYISLFRTGEYGYYGGQINVSNKLKLSVKNFYKMMDEQNSEETLVKRVNYKDNSYMVGALARLNNDYKLLNMGAKKQLKKLKHKTPINNSFYNVFAQSIEVIHFLEETKKLLNKYLINKKPPKNIKLNNKLSGFGLGAIEAPRGLLIHAYEVKDNIIKNCNIITPTAQFLNNLEEDIEKYLSKTTKISLIERKNKIKILIRAYDPCISCATH